MLLSDQARTGTDFLRLCEKKRQELRGKVQKPTAMSGSGLPALPEGWVWSSLSSVCERVSVGHVGPTTEFFSNADDRIGLIRSQDVRPGRLEAENCARITPSFHASLKKSQLKGGDILVVRVGANRGDSCVVPHGLGELNCANIIFARPLYRGDFFGLFTRSELGQHLLLSASTGAAQGVINTQSVAALPVPVPAWHVQERIASILSAYDDLIENNTRRIAILEEMARRIYEEWFVRFRYPGHEVVRMVDSQIGPVPEGWPVVRLDDVLVLQRGFDLPRQDRIEGKYPIISAAGTSGTHDEYKVKGPGVVTGRSGSLGVVTYIEGDFWPLNTTLWVKKFAVGSPLYAFYVLQSIDLAGFNSGAAVPTLNRNDVHSLPVVKPTRDLLAAFDEAAGPMIELKRRLELANANLRTTRDLLLPKLISGELDVSELPLPEAVAA